MMVEGSVAIINIKIFPIGLQVMNLHFPDTPRTYTYILLGNVTFEAYP